MNSVLIFFFLACFHFPAHIWSDWVSEMFRAAVRLALTKSPPEISFKIFQLSFPFLLQTARHGKGGIKTKNKPTASLAGRNAVVFLGRGYLNPHHQLPCTGTRSTSEAPTMHRPDQPAPAKEVEEQVLMWFPKVFCWLLSLWCETITPRL